MSVEELVKRARYHVGNPSAWDTYDEGASEIIRSLADKLEELAAALAERLAEEARLRRALIDASHRIDQLAVALKATPYVPTLASLAVTMRYTARNAGGKDAE